MSESLTGRLRRSGVLPILRLRDHGLALEVGRALARAGIDAIELTLDDPGALASLRRLSSELSEHMLLGAGTVLSPQQVAAAAEAGARFLVTPNVDRTVIAAADDAGLQVVPGACTATELAEALVAGVEVIKLFPAGPLGIGYMRALLGPFESARLLPTGGIDPAGAGDWIAAGALAVGIGSSLVPPRPTYADLEGIEQRAHTALAAAREARRR